MKLGIFGRIVIPVLAVLAVGMGTSGWLTSRSVAARLVANAEAELSGGAETLAQRLGDWLGDARVDLGFWGQEPVFVKSAGNDFIGQQARKAASERLAVLRATYTDFDAIHLVAPDGSTIASSSAEAVGKLNFSDRPFVVAALAGTPSLSDGFRSKRTGRAVCGMTQPVRQGKDGPVVAALYAVVDLGSFAQKTVATLQYGEQGYAELFDGTGACLAHPSLSASWPRSMRWSRCRGARPYVRRSADWRGSPPKAPIRSRRCAASPAARGWWSALPRWTRSSLRLWCCATASC